MLGASGRILPSLGIKPVPKGHHLSVGATYHAIGALGQAAATGGAQEKCTPSTYRRVARWEHEAVLEAAQQRLDREPDAMRLRRQTVEQPFGTLKAWMGATHFLTRTLDRVSTEMRLHVLAYNLKRAMKIFGIGALMAAMQA